MLKKLPLLLLLYLPLLNSEEYLSQEAFLNEIFAGKPPKQQIFWLQKKYKPAVSDILQHKPGFLRTRYWRDGHKSAWVLDEIGKTKPITVGVLIESNQIKLIKVLMFRESRGWEVKHDFFTDQFKDAQLTDELKLSKPIDGISGATLSVRALTKVARLALFFNQQLAYAKN